MNSEPRRRGRRDNGLDAAAYAPLADVDPRVGEHLLDVLWAAGVPAYLEPASDVHPTRAVTVPSPPTDRLWVDSSRRAEAWTVIRTDTPGATSWPADEPAIPTATGEHDRASLRAEEQSAWDALIAGYDVDDGTDSAAPGPARWPAAEDLTPPSGPPGTTSTEHPGSTEHVDSRPTPGAPAAGPRDYVPPSDEAVEAGLAGDPDEHFHPPAPPPLPRLSVEAIGALLLMLAGIFLLVAPGLIGMSGDAPFGLGVLGIVGGAGLLVWRLRADRSDDDPDDGARV